MPVVFTPLMNKRLTRRAQEMIERTLPYFPELAGKTITVGYTKKHLGSATAETRDAMGFVALDGIKAVLAGRTPPNAVA